METMLLWFSQGEGDWKPQGVNKGGQSEEEGVGKLKKEGKVQKRARMHDRTIKITLEKQ